MAIVTCVRCGHESDLRSLLDPSRSDGVVHFDGSICPKAPIVDIRDIRMDGLTDEEWEAYARALNDG